MLQRGGAPELISRLGETLRPACPQVGAANFEVLKAAALNMTPSADPNGDTLADGFRDMGANWEGRLGAMRGDRCYAACHGRKPNHLK